MIQNLSPVFAVTVGLAATLLMDVWNMGLKRVFGIPSLDYCLLGRWIAHMRRGTFRHENIATARAGRFECALGWVAHYTIGVVLTFGFFLLAPGAWAEMPTPGPALAYGIVTAAVPLFVMQPALGFGIASSKTRSPVRARLKTLMTHSVFGLGIYVSALGAGAVRQLMA